LVKRTNSGADVSALINAIGQPRRGDESKQPDSSNNAFVINDLQFDCYRIGGLCLGINSTSMSHPETVSQLDSTGFSPDSRKPGS
jgi:hypothetical protein